MRAWQLFVLLAAVFVAGCTSKRWTCEACVKGDRSHCARSVDQPSPNRSEVEARCSASEQVCLSVVDDKVLFPKLCSGERTSRMMGCRQDFVEQFEHQCSESTSVGLPIRAGL
jgi:hypothetical protein